MREKELFAIDAKPIYKYIKDELTREQLEEFMITAVESMVRYIDRSSKHLDRVLEDKEDSLSNEKMAHMRMFINMVFAAFRAHDALSVYLDNAPNFEKFDDVRKLLVEHLNNIEGAINE